MHTTAVVLVAAAGLCYCLAALLRWRAMAVSDEDRRSAHLFPLWIGLALHTAGLVLSLIDASRRDFAYAVLAVWAAVAALFFVSRYLASPSRAILVLPVGAMAMLVAMAGLAGPAPEKPVGEMIWIVRLHVVSMSAHLAAMLLAGAAGGMWLVAANQLRSPSPRALRLPSLPVVERLAERSLVVATALLLAGLATGGAAMQQTGGIDMGKPSIALALLTMVLLVAALALRATGRLSRRSAAIAAVATMVVAALGGLSQLVVKHG